MDFWGALTFSATVVKSSSNLVLEQPQFSSNKTNKKYGNRNPLSRQFAKEIRQITSENMEGIHY